MGAKLTIAEAEEVGRMCRVVEDGNLLVGSFAAELVGESYPFSKAMSAIVFKGYTDEELGRKFAAWADTAHVAEK